MKYFVALLLGFATGVVAALALLFVNPLAKPRALSPVAISDNELLVFTYSAVADDTIVYTNDGESIVRPHPDKVLQLWERPISRTAVFATLLSDSRNQPAGIGIKFRSDSEASRLIAGEALADSVWYLYLPERGSLFVGQRENYWSFLREVVAPAYWSAADNWKGKWFGNVTAGPNALGTGRVSGGSGDFRSVSGEAVEALSATAFSLDVGPVAVDGTLTIELSDPHAADALTAEPTLDQPDPDTPLTAGDPVLP